MPVRMRGFDRSYKSEKLQFSYTFLLKLKDLCDTIKVMNHKNINIFQWLLIFIAIASGGCLLFQGCSKRNPTEAPVSTVITGTGRLQVSYGASATYQFKNGQTIYGSFQLWGGAQGNPLLVQLRSNYGIISGSGYTAPDSGYFREINLDAIPQGQSYFLKTDSAPHYGKIVITYRGDASDVTTIDFNWLVQTVAGNRSLQ
ncbi:MAG: hypothetical protein QME74_06460 [Candidatus Edwardsbacteria bacterium]|nr:hypothetical protein [Candidatus Edwardsbacteria bacterium]